MLIFIVHCEMNSSSVGYKRVIITGHNGGNAHSTVEGSHESVAPVVPCISGVASSAINRHIKSNVHTQTTTEVFMNVHGK